MSSYHQEEANIPGRLANLPISRVNLRSPIESSIRPGQPTGLSIRDGGAIDIENTGCGFRNIDCGRHRGSNLFFGESNFLTLVPSGQSETQPVADRGRLSFPITTVATTLSKTHAVLSTGVIHLSPGTERYLRDEGALTFPSLQTCMPVIRAYFKWFHPCFPVLDRPDIAKRLETADVSPLLLQSILFIGATYCDEGAIVDMGFRDRTEAKSLLYTRARLLFHADWEKDQTTLIQALFLMSFWRGESSDVRYLRYWLGVVITLAETYGLHRSAKLTTRDPQVARMRRRIWWSVYARERQSAASLGLPMRIRDGDCNIEPLTVSDLESDNDESALTDLGSSTAEQSIYPIKMVELSRLLGQIIDVHFIPGRTLTAQYEILNLKTSFEEWRHSLPADLRRVSAEDDPSVWTCLLHLAYNHLRISIHRNGFLRHDEGDTQAALSAANQVSRIAEDMLERKSLQVGWRLLGRRIGRLIAAQYGQMHLITSLYPRYQSEDSRRCQAAPRRAPSPNLPPRPQRGPEVLAHQQHRP